MKTKFFFLIIWLIYGPSLLLAQTTSVIYVKVNGTGDGSSWENATSDLHSAMLKPYAVIWVAAGTYYGDTVSYNPCAFEIEEGVKLYGGFKGDEPSDYDLNLRDFQKNPTVLDGRNKKRVLSNRHFESDLANGQEPDSTFVDGLILQHGTSTLIGVSGYPYGGGGARVLSVHFRNCVIRENMAPYPYYTHQGIGVFAYRSSFYNCRIEKNVSERGNYVYGVGFYVEFSCIDHCVIIENRADVYPGENRAPTVFGTGGYLSASIMKNSLVSHNFTCIYDSKNEAFGGGVYADSSAIENCEISYDTIVGGGYTAGGGVASGHGSCITASSIHHNHAYHGGGLTSYSQSRWYADKIHHNSCLSDGGGALAVRSDFVNCSFDNNSSKNGGGVYVYYIEETDVSRLYNCNIVRNFAQDEGGGLYNEGDAVLHCVNGIIWGNRMGLSSALFLYGVSDVTYSAVEGGYSGTGNLNLATSNTGESSDSLYVVFLSPSDEAGDASEEEANWLLSIGSACIDMGMSDTLGMHLPLTDLRGDPRIYNQRIDMGAYEYFPGNPVREASENACIAYPNPAHSQIYIHSDEPFLFYRVVDMSGRVCCQGESESQTDMCLHTASWPAGMYVLQLQTLTGSRFLKLQIR